MKKRFKKPDKITYLVLGSSLLCIPILVIVFWGFGIVFTYTGSIPVGFYRIVSMNTIRRSAYISFCLPGKIAKMGLKRGYIHEGRCANGSEELIKQVIAVPGDVVALTNHEIFVQEKLFNMSYLAPRVVLDKEHLAVCRFIKEGIYQVKNYWVYRFASQRYSWDSRYYGGIPRSYIKHRLVPLGKSANPERSISPPKRTKWW